jgi:O-antigen/teichoic acid export membrane protein
VSAVTSAARAPRREGRPRLEAVDKRDAALMSIGTLSSGVLAYAFNVLAARSLGPESYGAVGALWAGMFLLAVLLFRPIEQTVSRAISDQLARGADARPVVRSAARLCLLVTIVSTAVLLALWGPITNGLFAGNDVLTAALVLGLIGYAGSYFARGLVGGVRWFGGYGLVLLADGAVRVALALPLLVIASETVAAVAIAVAAASGAVAPLLSKRRSTLHKIAGPPGKDYSLGSATRFAMPAAVIAGCEQVLVSGGPLLVLIVGGSGAAAAAGVLFAATLMVRAPVFLFQGVAASLLPNLTTFEARGDSARVHHAVVLTALGLAGLSLVLAAGSLIAGPAAMSIVYGDGFDATRGDLALLSLGIGGFLSACTFCQALLARGNATAAAARWTAAAVTFVAIELLVGGSEFHRVSIAFAAASGLAAALLITAVWRQRA